MRTYKGSYGNETMESNALVTNLLKFPEIERKLTRQFPQYSVAYFTEGTGRFAKEKLIGDVKFSWPILGRTNRPSTCTGTSSGDGSAHASATVEFEENYFNPNDVIRFADGNQGVIIGLPVASAGGYTYTYKLQDSSIIGTSAVAAAALLAGITVGKIGTAFTESSEKGYENHVYPDWYTNYIGINRKARSISGSALTDVTWIENAGSRLWYFTDQMIAEDDFRYEKELDAWYSISTMDSNGNPTMFDTNGRPIIKGDGLLRQIDSANIDTYNGILTEQRIQDFLMQLFLNTGKKGQHWLVYTGSGGRVAFANAMKAFVMTNGNMIYNAAVGKEMNIGVNFSSYNAFGVSMTLVDAPIFDDPNIHGNNIDANSGLPKESFRMVFMNFDMVGGESNIERLVKGAEGMSRGYICKYIAGMVNPFDQKTMMSANSSDSFKCEYLTEGGYIIRNPLSCGMLVMA
jgi:hypothetical protein